MFVNRTLNHMRLFNSIALSHFVLSVQSNISVIDEQVSLLKDVRVISIM